MIKGVPEGRKAQARKVAAQMSMSFEDGKCTASIGGQSKSGIYKVTTADGDTLTVETELNGKKESLVIEMDGDPFKTTLDRQSMSFVRSDWAASEREP